MAFLSKSRMLFVEATPASVKRILANQDVRVIPHGDALLICAGNFSELVLVSPSRRKDGSIGLGYALRDPAALARVVELLKTARMELKKKGIRTGEPKHSGRSGKIA